MAQCLNQDAAEAFQAIDELGRLTSPDAIMARLAGYLSRYGFTSFVITGLPSQDERVEPYILLNGWPEGWFERYMEANHYQHDPCVRYCFETTEPFAWSELPDTLLEQDRSRRVMAEATAFGLNEGFCIPLHDVYGSQAIVTMAGGEVHLPARARRMVHLTSLYAYGVAERVNRQAAERATEEGLTQRERDVIQWTAQGKTFWEIGVILGITEATVNDHMRNIRRKLDTRNAAHSVAEAVRRGTIRL